MHKILNELCLTIVILVQQNLDIFQKNMSFFQKSLNVKKNLSHEVEPGTGPPEIFTETDKHHEDVN